ncbi:MAG: response regulator [Clostridiales bacterium]|nr:response regulator [Clostridiales bacterium]
MTTVLICDDSVAVHESLRVYLEESGIRVLSAYNGEDALQTLRTQSVQLLILDLMLPGRLGTEILRELRQFSSVPVLILSAKDSEFDRILGLELGADDYVVKPFSPREVAARVRTILKRTGRVPEHRILTFYL